MQTFHQRITELFSLGSYTSVARAGNQECWQTYAAKGLIGKTEEAVEGLNQFDCQEAVFYKAASYWIGGDDLAAQDLLQDIPTPHAQNLLHLIRKPQIQVLAQLPWTRSAPHDLLTAATQDSKFVVRNISFHPEDLQNQPYADIRKFYNPQHPPDFYISMMAEWHLIPPNLQELPCPILGQTADYDLHIQAVYPWLQLFDEFVVTDPTEWQDARSLVKVPVSTFPKSFGLSVNLPPLIKQSRYIDVFVSGTTLHPYHPDKAVLYHQILRMPDINPLFVHGFMSQQEYYNLLLRSKLCFTHVRHAGATPTRGLEALSMGCAIAVHKDCVLQLFVGEREGVVGYERDLTPAIQKILSRWSEFEESAWRGAKIIREEFALPKVASQYLRFLTFLAAKPRSHRSSQPVGNLAQKRSVLQKGWLPGDRTTLETISRQNLRQWQAQWERAPSLRVLIDMARELVLEYAQAVEERKDAAKHDLLEKSLALYREGLILFPRSLVLRFNFIRISLHFGRQEEVLKARQLAEETLSIPIDTWEIDSMEDVFPWDLFNQFFNYRKYFDLATQAIGSATQTNAQSDRDSDSFKQVILASIHFYLSQYSQHAEVEKTIEHLKSATAFDPDFPYYRLSYAEQLFQRGNPEDIEKATALLLELANSSTLFMEACDLLLEIYGQKIFQNERFSETVAAINRAERYTIFLEKLGNKNLQSLTDLPLCIPPASYKLISHKQSQPRRSTKVSIIVLGWAEGDSSLQMLDLLSQQTVPRDSYELIWVGLHERADPEVLQKADIVLGIACDRQETYHKHIAYNAGLLHANGSIVAICENDAKLVGEFVATIARAFKLDISKQPPQVVVTSIDRTYVAFRKVDIIRLGGFDEHGYRGALYSLVRRALNAGLREIQPDRVFENLLDFVSWDFWTWRSGYFGLLPQQENQEIRQLRLALRNPGATFNRELARKIAIGEYSIGKRLELQVLLFLDTFILESGLIGMMGRPGYMAKAQLLISLKRLIGYRAYEILKRWWYFLRGVKK